LIIIVAMAMGCTRANKESRCLDHVGCGTKIDG
jgi:hypothetical protein